MDEVLAFWFPPGLDADADVHMKQLMRWFRGGEEMDRAVEPFRDTWERACRGELDDWAATVRGRLALLIVLDQFSRHLGRGTPRAFAQDAKAQKLALEAIENQLTDGLAIWELQYFAVVLGHSEDLMLHDKALPWYEKMVAERTPPHLLALYQRALQQPRGHRETIARFGRHPHRNAILGRTSTPEELQYLASTTPVHLRPIS